MENLNYGKNGITLIALVITVIVLIILAGVAISMLSGDNGILNQAARAKFEIEDAENIEKIKMAVSEAQIGENGYQNLNQENLQEAVDKQFEGTNVVLYNEDGTYTVSCLDELKDYIITDTSVEEGIDWSEAMSNAQAPQSQDENRNDGVIGIGTDGKAVDMDLWEYTIMENGTYGLNDGEALNGSNSSKGYLGNFSEDGEIECCIPQYISNDNGKTYIQVTNLTRTFYNCTFLKKMPSIPTTVRILESTFANCNNLSQITSLPQYIENLRSSFYNCTNLEEVPQIPSKVTNLISTFSGCTSLRIAPNIPEGINSLKSTFENCTNLQVTPFIPDGVVDLTNTFSNCTNLKEVINIPTSVTTLTSTFQNCYELTEINIELSSNIINIERTFNHCRKIYGRIIINSNNIESYNYFLNDAAITENKLFLSGSCINLELIESTKSDNSNIVLE